MNETTSTWSGMTKIAIEIAFLLFIGALFLAPLFIVGGYLLE